MKKSIAVLAALALFASAAFGEIALSGSGRIVFVPFGLRFENSDAGFDINAARPFRLWGLTTVKFAGYSETDTVGGPTVKLDHGTNFAIVLTPMYYIRSDLIVLADLFFDMRAGSEVPALYNDAADGDPTRNNAGNKNNYLDLGFGLYIRKNIAGGDVRAGVTCKLPGGEAHEGAKPQIYVPVMFNYAF